MRFVRLLTWVCFVTNRSAVQKHNASVLTKYLFLKLTAEFLMLCWALINSENQWIGEHSSAARSSFSLLTTFSVEQNGPLFLSSCYRCQWTKWCDFLLKLMRMWTWCLNFFCACDKVHSLYIIKCHFRFQIHTSRFICLFVHRMNNVKSAMSARVKLAALAVICYAWKCMHTILYCGRCACEPVLSITIWQRSAFE